jgi:hypothetical protein
MIAPLSMAYGGGATDLNRAARGVPAFDTVHSETRSAPGTREQQALDAASRLVAVAFIEPIVASMRSSPLAPQSGPFATTIAEERFGPMFDALLADEVAKASQFPLARTIAERLLGTETGGDAAPTPWSAPDA